MIVDVDEVTADLAGGRAESQRDIEGGEEAPPETGIETIELEVDPESDQEEGPDPGNPVHKDQQAPPDTAETIVGETELGAEV